MRTITQIAADTGRTEEEVRILLVHALIGRACDQILNLLTAQRELLPLLTALSPTRAVEMADRFQPVLESLDRLGDHLRFLQTVPEAWPESQ